MKLIFKIIIFTFLLAQILVFGQNTSDDSLLKKAYSEIYDRPDSAISIGKKILKKEKDINQLIKIYSLISTANIAKRNFEESLQYIIKAKELGKKTNDLKTQTSLLISLAIQYEQMELFSKSFETLDEADTYLTKLPDGLYEKYFETGRSYAIRGMIYKSQSNSEIALEKFLVSVANFEKIKAKKRTYVNLSIVYYNIGSCYLNLDQSKKAKSAFLKAIDYAQKDQAKSLEAFGLKGLAEMYKLNHESQTALDLLHKAENLCSNTGDLALSEGIYKEMSDNYLALGNSALYQTYNNKVFALRFKREENELSSINHSIDDYNKEIIKKIQDVKLHFKYIRISIIIIGLAISLLLISLILKIKRENKKYQTEIQKLIRY